MHVLPTWNSEASGDSQRAKGGKIPQQWLPCSCTWARLAKGTHCPKPASGDHQIPSAQHIKTSFINEYRVSQRCRASLNLFKSRVLLGLRGPSATLLLAQPKLNANIPWPRCPTAPLPGCPWAQWIFLQMSNKRGNTSEV